MKFKQIYQSLGTFVCTWDLHNPPILDCKVLITFAVHEQLHSIN
jgi:hypothetical protein